MGVVSRSWFGRLSLLFFLLITGFFAVQCSSSVTIAPNLSPTSNALATPAHWATPIDVASPTVTSTGIPFNLLTLSPTTVVKVPTEPIVKATSTLIASPTTAAAPSPLATFTAASLPTPTLLPTSAATLAAPVTARVPILMYHYVGSLPENPDRIRIDLTVAPETFRAEMQYLRDQGYQTIRLTELINHLMTGAPLPPKPLVLTFDDGYADNYTNAFPVLKEMGFTAAFFIITGRPDTNTPGYLTWPQIEEMAASGMQIGSHSVDHRFNLAQLSAARQRAEILPSRDAVAAHLPNMPAIFAYPSGSYNATTLEILKELGYVAAVTTKQGTLQSGAAPYELHRIRVRGEWSLQDFVHWMNYWLR